jgi:DNA repair protein RecN (Recombination protein N)
MIHELRVENLAIIQNVTVEFEPGFSVLTGETGAGKSLLIDALELALGERADVELVRTGAAKASVQLVVSVSDSIREWCQNESIEPEEDRLYIHREVLAEGRSQAKVNGRSIPIATLKSLGKLLVDLHGQHQHQALFDPLTHIDFLDLWIGDEARQLVDDVTNRFQTYSELKRRSDALRKNVREREQKMDMLKFQVEEITAFCVVVGEESEATQTLNRLRNLEKISQAVGRALDSLAEAESNARDLLGAGVRAAEDAARFDDSLNTTALESSVASLSEGINELYRYADSLEMDPNRLEELEERLDQLRKLKRKYGDSEQEILDFLTQAEGQLTDLENAEASQETIEAELEQAKSQLHESCNLLSELRRSRAPQFSKDVEAHFTDLSMPKARLPIQFEVAEVSDKGSDAIQFLFSANAGEELKPLTKIASGGEISRVMLAMKSALAGRAGVPTLIFDEVDTGLGGQAAAAVGRKIAELSRHYQVISISHLPQVASQAATQYRIEKTEHQGRVTTQVVRLSSDERIDEIARMLAGEEISESARANAKDLLSISLK